MAHESQVPNAGDFFLNYIGEDRVIVVRDKEGGVQVLLNTCRHRGNAVCRAEEGHATSFMCTYHGWTYDLKGALVGVPGFKDYYHEDLKREEWGLITPAKVLFHGRLEDEAFMDILLSGDLRQLRVPGGPDKVERVRSIAPDHVHVQHGHRAVEREQWMPDVGFGAKEPALLSGEQEFFKLASLIKKKTGGNLASAKEIGKAVAEKAKAKGIEKVVFDRGGYLYHGRVKALAEAAREAGLKF
jgi:nitrite reductase/ring-hydroxylating ferredoxin subunit